MVFKILKAAGSSIRSVNYNERKVLSEDAEIMLWENFPSSSLYSIYSTLERYESNPAVSARTRSYSFHAAMCPGIGDGITEAETLDLIKKVMNDLGYGKQPFAVYRHHDIDRIHYHIVSVRVDEKGRAIDRHNDGYRARQIMLDHSHEYHYTLGKDETSLAQTFGTATMYKKFDYSKSNILAQVKSILEQSLEYRYTSFSQFRAVMRTKGVNVEVMQRRSGGNRLVFTGIDGRGRAVTKPILENDIEVNAYECYESRLETNFETVKVHSKAAARVAATAAFLLQRTNSEGEFISLMESKNIKVKVFHQNKDVTRPIEAMIFIDEKSKTCIKDTDLGEELSLKDFNAALNNGQWGVERNTPRKSLSRQQEDEYRAFMEKSTEEAASTADNLAILKHDISEEYEFTW